MTQHARNNGGQAQLVGKHNLTDGDPTTQPDRADGRSTAQPEHAPDDPAQAARTGKLNFSEVRMKILVNLKPKRGWGHGEASKLAD